MSGPPPIPDYYQPQKPDDGRRLRGFIIGLGAGGVVSFVTYAISMGLRAFVVLLAAMLIILALKIIVGIVCMVKPGLASVGIGVFTSIALGGLIAFGICAMHG